MGEASPSGKQIDLFYYLSTFMGIYEMKIKSVKSLLYSIHENVEQSYKYISIRK